MSSATEIVACALCGLLVNCGVRFKVMLIFGFAVSTAGMGMLVYVEEPSDAVRYVSIILAKTGVSAGFVVAFTGNYALFPAAIAGSAFGICNAVARTLTVVAPFLAELDPVRKG